jgi:hypothetical protein
LQAARARLPFNVLQAQVKTAGEGVRGEDCQQAKKQFISHSLRLKLP